MSTPLLHPLVMSEHEELAGRGVEVAAVISRPRIERRTVSVYTHI
jgi:hypothetical protein